MLLLDEKAKNEIFTQIHIDPEVNFKILKPLGEGAYGAVFKALDRRDNQLVALKVMRFDPEECQDLLSEIRILRQCNNDYIVNFKDTFHKDGNIWLAMEFCEGGSALDIVKVTKHTLSERQCQCVLFHSLKGLQYLHSKNLIHRDIKAANILINKDGRCKLADFGVAKSVRASGAGTTIGSPYWMAPEVLGTEKYDNSADIWSLGIVAIEMAIGKPPLSNYKPLQAMFMIPKNEPPTIPEDYIDDFSAGFIAFIAKCLSKNPAARPTAKQLLQSDEWINKVAHPINAVEKELMPWIRNVMPLIEKDRDLQARIANQDESYDESKWSDYTSSVRHLSIGNTGTMNNNGTINTNTNNNGTLKVVHDDEEDLHDPYADNGGTILIRKSSSDSTKQTSINDEADEDEDEEDNFDGGTMITVQTKHDEEEEDEEDEEDEEEEDEYHENGFSPSSQETPINSPHHHSTHSALTQSTVTTAAPVDNNHHNNQSKREYARGGGGGYSLGNSSFDGNTMVRQNSTDDEEEDPFQGQTMYRAPTVESPRLLLDDENVDEDEDDPYNLNINMNDTDTVTSMNTTKPAMSISPKTNITQFQPRSVAMSDDEDVRYEPTRGYINKPSTPISVQQKSQAQSRPQPRQRPSLKSKQSNHSDASQPQPQSYSFRNKNKHKNKHKQEVIGSAGIMNVIVKQTKGRNSTSSKVKNGHSLQLNSENMNAEMPTSPIPHYKHIQILTDHNKIYKNEETHDHGHGAGTIKALNVLEEIKKLSILANQLDFTKLVSDTGISCTEHFLLIIGVLITWIFIISYITLEVSEVKRPREMQLFIVSSALAIIFNLVLNPFYFKSFSYKYVPNTIQQLFAKTQPMLMDKGNINIGLRINHNIDNDRLIDNESSDGSDDTIVGATDAKSSKKILFICLVWLLRIFALIAALALSYFIYLDLAIEQYTEFTRYCIVLLTLALFVGNLPLMGHFMLYFRNVFIIYYLLGWIIVFGAEFVYFHFVRHVKEQDFATFFIINIIFLLFHIIATFWCSYMVKHQTLYEIDPISFPGSNHYRIYFARTSITNIITSDGYVANAVGVSNTTPVPSTHMAHPLRQRPYRTVTCCCSKLICDSHTLLRFQSYASAISFWSFLGIIYTIGFEYVVYASCVFLLINTIWNPLYYSKEVIDIRNKFALCCSLKRWFYELMLTFSYGIGLVLNAAWFAFSISAFILYDGKQIQHATIINIIIFLVATLIFFLPAIGYSFYRIPVSYAIANIFGALFCFFIPICISFKPPNNNQILQDWFFIYNDQYDNLPMYLGIIVCAVVFSLYLVFTGASCVVYRLRKALVERKKSYFKKEFPMNMMMFWSFLLSFVVLTFNSLWVFGDNFGGNTDSDRYDSIYIISKLVYVVTLAVQCSSLMYAIFTLKHKFDDNPQLKPYLPYISDKIRNSCGFCCYLLLFPVIYCCYLIFILLISLCLGVTKLLTIRQVREFWLSFLIANNGQQESKPNGGLQSVATNSELVTTNSNANVIEVEVMSLNKQIDLGEMQQNPTSPNTDFLQQESDSSNNTYRRNTNGSYSLHHRVSSSVLKSVNMKVYQCFDCCTPEWMASLFINESVYNNYLMSELIVESLPLLMLNLVNMFLLNNDRITTVSLIQAAASTLFLFYSIAKTLFFLRFHEWNLAKFLS